MVVARRRDRCGFDGDDSKDDVCVVDKQIMRASLLVHTDVFAPLAVVPFQPRYSFFKCSCRHTALLSPADRLYHYRLTTIQQASVAADRKHRA